MISSRKVKSYTKFINAVNLSICLSSIPGSSPYTYQNQVVYKLERVMNMTNTVSSDFKVTLLEQLLGELDRTNPYRESIQRKIHELLIQDEKNSKNVHPENFEFETQAGVIKFQEI